MRCVGRQQKDVAFPNRHVNRLAVIDHLEDYIALDLIKEFLAAINVVIGTAVGSADYHYDKLTIFPDELVAHGRLQQVTVFVNPLLEIYGRQVTHAAIIAAWNGGISGLAIKSICYYLLKIVGIGEMTQKTYQRVPVNVVPEKSPSPLGNYSHAVKAGPLLFVSGMGARDPKTGTESGVTLDAQGNVTAYDIEEQTHACIRNLQTVLEAAGCALTDVVDMSVFLADMADFQKYNHVYGEYFSFEGPPARTTIQAAALPGKNFIEIKAIALCP